MSTIGNDKSVMLAISVVNQAKSVLTRREYIQAMSKAVMAESSSSSRLTLQEYLFGSNHEEIKFRIEVEHMNEQIWTSDVPSSLKTLFIKSIAPNLIEEAECMMVSIDYSELMKALNNEWNKLLQSAQLSLEMSCDAH